MGATARELAGVLNRSYVPVDVAESPDYAVRHRMFFPAMVVVDDFRLVYPGTAQQMLESYRRSGPIPGELAWRELPAGDVTSVMPLTPGRAGEASAICLGDGASGVGVGDKERWLEDESATVIDGICGLIGYCADTSVGGVEFVRETRIPYPIPGRRENWIFVTCLYSAPSALSDYRPVMLQQLVGWARELGYRGVSAVTGEETPYPNGPLRTFERAGFSPGPTLGRALLRNRWETMRFMSCEL